MSERQSRLIEVDISTEKWREYDFTGRIYRINNPKNLFYRPNASEHHIVDVNGVEHTVPAPGTNGCILRTKENDIKVKQ